MFKEDSFVAVVLSIGEEKQAANKNKFFILVVSDGVTKKQIFCWDNKRGDFAKGNVVYGKVRPFGDQGGLSTTGALQIVHKDVRVCTELDKEKQWYDKNFENILFEYKVNVDEFSKDLRAFIDENIQEKRFKKLLYACSDVEFLSKLKDSPAAVLVHHNLRGGLLYHIRCMFELYRGIHATRSLEPHNKGLVLLGILLHDMGKSLEYEIDSNDSIKITLTGRALGHIYIGSKYVEQLIEEIDAELDIDGFSKDEKLLCIHMILSHHGKTDGSPVTPLIKEAWILHYIDNLDAKLNIWENTNEGTYSKYLDGYTFKDYIPHGDNKETVLPGGSDGDGSEPGVSEESE